MSDAASLNLIRIEGDMYLYEKPELLDFEQHGNLGISNIDRPFEFAAGARAVPIVVSELVTAQKHFPIVFSSLENPLLLAVTGLFDGQNLFVNNQGEWQQDVYVPAYLRCHPFAFAEGPDENFAVVIDRAARSVTESPDEPFFEGDQLSEKTKARVDFYGRYGAERIRTRQFCQRVAELGLLSGQQVTRTIRGEQENLASYVAVDAGRLEKLDSGQLWELHGSGLLAAIYGHIFSLDNWNGLIQRHRRRLKN